MIREKIKSLVLENGAAEAEIIKISAIDTSLFCERLSCYPAELDYLRRGERQRANPQLWFPGARSALLAIFPYWQKGISHCEKQSEIKDPYAFLENTGRKPPAFLKGKRFSIARYALCTDYHITVRHAMEKALSIARNLFADLKWKIFVDSSPVLEKELAAKAGLAFPGKNTLAINEKIGSYFCIGGAMLNLDCGIEPIEVKSLCQNCQRCINACPTGALSEYKLEPLKCLSYWTTHNKKNTPPLELLDLCEKTFGCDICQEACPYNK
ncbi:MAG: hypothetical protein Fur0012_13360 [Elusimicrobiota bacterium]